MKKEYMKPIVLVVKLKTTNRLLTVSGLDGFSKSAASDYEGDVDEYAD